MWCDKKTLSALDRLPQYIKYEGITLRLAILEGQGYLMLGYDPVDVADSSPHYNKWKEHGIVWDFFKGGDHQLLWDIDYKDDDALLKAVNMAEQFLKEKNLLSDEGATKATNG